eukprot:2227356-Prorocentrum_lima.AAC.1
MSLMKCARIEMCLVLNAAFGPKLTRVIAAELSFSTRVRGTACIHSPNREINMFHDVLLQPYPQVPLHKNSK